MVYFIGDLLKGSGWTRLISYVVTSAKVDTMLKVSSNLILCGYVNQVITA